jgi:hypothetical protein
MANDPTSESHSRIRRVLKFITKADIAVIQAADLLEILEGDENPQGPADLLKRHPFVVKEPNGGTHTFTARLTQAQIDYLNKFTKTLKDFEKAVLSVLQWSGVYVVRALTDLATAIAAPVPREEADKRDRTGPGGGGIDPPPLGCCYYDTNLSENDISESYCEGALQGQWSPNPCRARPLHTDS